MEMPVIPQPNFYIFKCEQSSPPGMPKPSCVNEHTRDLFNHMAQRMMEKGLMGPVMAEYRGKVPGKTIFNIIKEEIGNL